MRRQWRKSPTKLLGRPTRVAMISSVLCGVPLAQTAQQGLNELFHFDREKTLAAIATIETLHADRVAAVNRMFSAPIDQITTGSLHRHAGSDLPRAVKIQPMPRRTAGHTQPEEIDRSGKGDRLPTRGQRQRYLPRVGAVLASRAPDSDAGRTIPNNMLARPIAAYASLTSQFPEIGPYQPSRRKATINAETKPAASDEPLRSETNTALAYAPDKIEAAPGDVFDPVLSKTDTLLQSEKLANLTAPTQDVEAEEIEPNLIVEATEKVDYFPPDLPRVRPSRPGDKKVAKAETIKVHHAPREHSWAKKRISKATLSRNEQTCLANAVYFEARGESVKGQIAVAQVVINRVKNPAYPRTICGVVYQNKKWRNRCQFSFACDGIRDRISNKRLYKQAKQIARDVTTGKKWLKAVGDSTHYHATYVRPRWARTMKRKTKIGLHIFYRTYGGGWS